MDWRAFLASFTLIFLAELGDKTQLACLAMAAKYKAPVAVFLGAALALVLTSLLGVTIGGTLTRFIPREYIQKGAALLFLAMGVFMLFSK